jgi:hypothetical protein
MRYKIVAVPVMDRYHVTLTAWDYETGRERKHVVRWDLGRDELAELEIRDILSYLAADLAE